VRRRRAQGVTLAAAAALVAGLAAAEPASRLRWTVPADRAAPLAPDVGGPSRVGRPVSAGISPETWGEWQAAPGGGRIWRLELRSPGALWLVLGFDRFRLPPGARLTVRAPDRGRPVTLTGADERPDGERWLAPLPGDTLLLELSWPADLAGREPVLRLGTVTHGYLPWGGIGEGHAAAAPLADCNIDVRCSPQGDPWQTRRRGVVQLLIGGTGASCTGSMVNTTALDCAPLLLTANHCFDGGGTAASATVLFNFERQACGSGLAPTGQTITGATTLASYGPSDFHLLALDDAPPREFGAFYNGWNRAAQAASSTTTIHHPVDPDLDDVLPKKVTRDDQPPLSGGTFGPHHWTVVQWEDGQPTPGSSGAPLFDQNRRIVAQLHGGAATTNCGAPGPTEFGKLSTSWSGGGTSATQLSHWLGGGASSPTVVLDGIDRETCLSTQTGVRPSASTVDDDTAAGNGDGSADPGDVLQLAIELFNRTPAAVTGVSALLSTTNPNVTLLDPHATWPDIAALSFAASDSPHFGIELKPTLTCGATPLLTLTVKTDQGTWQSSLQLATGTAGTIFYDDVEGGVAGYACAPGLCLAGPWTASGQWARSTTASFSPTTSWRASVAAASTDSSLVAPTIVLGNLPQRSRLSFRHFVDTDIGFDGGVLEYTLNGGASWQDAYGLIVEGFYDSTIASGLSALDGRAAWSGKPGAAAANPADWRRVVVDLDPLPNSGQLGLRWRFATDVGGGATAGWFVDDVTIVGGNFACAAPRSRTFPGALCRGYRADSVPLGSCERAPKPRVSGPPRRR